MQTKGWRMDRALVERKLELHELQFSPHLVQAALDRAARDWDRDLRPLLAQVIPFNDARRAVVTYLIQDPNGLKDP